MLGWAREWRGFGGGGHRPLTVYGEGGQTCGIIGIRDTVRCIQLACENPVNRGEFRAFNQMPQSMSVAQIAETVQAAFPGDVTIESLDNPERGPQSDEGHPSIRGVSSRAGIDKAPEVGGNWVGAWEVAEDGGTPPREPGRQPSRSRGRAGPFSSRPLDTARYFLTGSAVTFSKYRACRQLRHWRRLGGASSFALAQEYAGFEL
jgi:hypothetical protein